MKNLTLFFLFLNLNIFAQSHLTLVDSLKCGYFVDDSLPKPFSPVLSLKFGIMDSSKVKIEVHKIFWTNNYKIFTTEPVRELLNKRLPGGIYIIKWDGRDDEGKMVKSDQYIYYLSAECINNNLIGSSFINFQAKARLTFPPSN